MRIVFQNPFIGRNTLGYMNKDLKMFLTSASVITDASVLHKNKKNCPANIYLFKVNNRNTRKMCEICSKFTITTLARRH